MPNVNTPRGSTYSGWFRDMLNNVLEAYYKGTLFLRATTTGAVTFANSLLSNHATAGIGYATGAGGTVTQASNKTTGVTLNTIVGQITMNNASLAAATEVVFVVTNSAVGASDAIIVNHGSVGASDDDYLVGVGAVAAGSFSIVVANLSVGSLAEAIVINFAVIKGVSA